MGNFAENLNLSNRFRPPPRCTMDVLSCPLSGICCAGVDLCCPSLIIVRIWVGKLFLSYTFTWVTNVQKDFRFTFYLSSN